MKKRSLRNIVVGLLVCALVLFAGCTSPTTTDDGGEQLPPIKIGVGAPLTGPSAQDGESIKDAVEVAAALINEEGGINGRMVEVVAYDDRTDPSEAAAVANKFAVDDSIMAVVGHFNSSATLAGVSIYESAQITSISPASTSPKLTGASDYFFRVCASDTYLGKTCADWSRDLGWERVAVLYENDDWGLGLMEQYTQNAEAYGIEIVLIENYLVGQTTDFSPLLTKIKQADVDGIFLGSLYNEAAMICKQALTLGIDLNETPVMGTDGIYSEAFIELGGDAVEGALLLSAFFPESQEPVVIKFNEDFKRLKGKEIPDNFNALAYDAAMVILNAMKTLDTIDRESVRDAVAQTTGYVGPTGVTTFNDQNDVEKAYVHITVKDGKFVEAD